MASAPGHTLAPLERQLLQEGNRFSFFQALRLLERLKKPTEHVRVRPQLSFGFPAADIRQIEAHPDGGYDVTATFLGLYGVSSPLPAFYTEDLFKDRRHDSSAVRDFLDIIHRRLYGLLYVSWQKYHVFQQVDEAGARTPLQMLYALTGLCIDASRGNSDDDYSLVRYSGLLGGRPRSAMALETMLADVLKGPEVSVISCVPRRMRIPDDQRLQLGSDETALGINSVLGEELTDIQGKFRVQIGPLSQKRFRALLPGGEEAIRLERLVKRFLVDPLEFDFELILAEGETRHARLGGQDWTRLGLDTVLFTTRHTEELHTLASVA